MKLSFALSVSTITAASMDEAVGDVPPPWIATTSSEAAAITAQKHRHDHHDHKIETETNGSAVYDRHHVKNNDDQYQKQPPESLPGLDDEMAPAAIAALFDNKEHASIMDSIMDSRTTTTIDSGSGDGITGDVDVDTGVLPISKRSLSSIEGAATLPIDSTRCQAGNYVYDIEGAMAESTCEPSFINKNYCCTSSYYDDNDTASAYYGTCAMVVDEDYYAITCTSSGADGDAFCQSLPLDNALGSRCVDDFYVPGTGMLAVCVLCCCDSFYVSKGAPACPGQQQQCNAASTNPSTVPTDLPSASNIPSTLPSDSILPSDSTLPSNMPSADVGKDCTKCTSSTVIGSGTGFKDLVSSCYTDASTCPDNVPIGCWDTSMVTDMAYAFDGKASFDDSINCWNVSSVTNMKFMFEDAYAFNQPLDDWDVASVKYMNSMFGYATTFNQPLDDWNVASVNDMGGMFQYATNFNQPLDDWNVASVTYMAFMFGYATTFNQPLNNWNVTRVTYMGYYFVGDSLGYGMFTQATNFNQPLNDWDVSSVNDMAFMFQGATSFNQPLDEFNVASVTDMSYMFGGTTNFNQPLDDWNVASVNSMDEMFFRTTYFNQCLSSWAAKTPPDVSVVNIFEDSGCPDKNPVATVGPWCQGEDDEQCIAQSATDAPTEEPTEAPTDVPTEEPTEALTDAPTEAPTEAPTDAPTEAPTTSPTKKQKKKSKKSKK